MSNVSIDEKNQNMGVVDEVNSAGEEEAEITKEAKELKRFDGIESPPNHPLSKAFQNPILSKAALVLLALSVIGYTIAVLFVDVEDGLPVVFIELFIFSTLILTLITREKRVRAVASKIESKLLGMDAKTTRIVYAVIMFVFLVTGFIVSINDLSGMFGFIGVIAIVLTCYIISWKRSKIQWRPVVWGFSLQFIFGLLILKTSAGEAVFKFFGDQIAVLQVYTNEGVAFVFGDLNSTGPFVLNVLPVIILYSGFTAILFHYGILQVITQAVGQTMVFTMGTSAPESLNAAGNIFLGQTESPLLIRPYLQYMTHSEIHAVMTGGFATIAGGVLVAFTVAGVPAEHLLSASVMSAPAALAISKIVYPETMKIDDTAMKELAAGEQYTNALEAFSRGASMSIALIASIVANLIAFLALIAFMNEIVVYFLSKLGVEDVNFETLVGYLFAPFAFLMGIPLEDCGFAGELLGIKTVTNEFVAFTALQESDLDPDGKSFLIMTYALCGFANFSSIGIQLGTLGAMAPSKLPVMASLAFSAMICGNLACFMTASIASILL